MSIGYQGYVHELATGLGTEYFVWTKHFQFIIFVVKMFLDQTFSFLSNNFLVYVIKHFLGPRTQPGKTQPGKPTTWKDTTRKDTTRKRQNLEETKHERDITRKGFNLEEDLTH